MIANFIKYRKLKNYLSKKVITSCEPKYIQMKYLNILFILLIAFYSCEKKQADKEKSLKWIRVANNGTSPDGRICHSAARIANTIVLFGGYILGKHITEDQYLAFSDTWEYDIVLDKWTQIESTGPIKRFQHTLISTGNEIYLFSGSYVKYPDEWNGYEGHEWFDLDDIWKYDVSDHSWSMVTETNQGHKPMNAPGVSYGGNGKVILFGGRCWENGIQVHYNETWEFDTQTYSWLKIKEQNHEPEPRCCCPMAWDGENTIVLFGGMDFSQSPHKTYSDTWEFDLLTNTWTKIVAANPDISPEYSSRAWGMTNFEKGKVVATNSYNLWIYDTQTNQWEDKGTTPDINRCFPRITNAGEKSLFIFGGGIGEYPNNMTVLNDTWIYKE